MVRHQGAAQVLASDHAQADVAGQVGLPEEHVHAVARVVQAVVGEHGAHLVRTDGVRAVEQLEARRLGRRRAAQRGARLGDQRFQTLAHQSSSLAS